MKAKDIILLLDSLRKPERKLNQQIRNLPVQSIEFVMLWHLLAEVRKVREHYWHALNYLATP